MNNFEELYMKKYANPENPVNVDEYKTSVKTKVAEYADKAKKKAAHLRTAPSLQPRHYTFTT